MGTLKPAQLRSLVRMYRQKVEGAREQLVELVTARPDVVAELLGPRTRPSRACSRSTTPPKR